MKITKFVDHKSLFCWYTESDPLINIWMKMNFYCVFWTWLQNCNQHCGWFNILNDRIKKQSSTFQACIIGIDPIRCCNVDIGCNFASFTSLYFKSLVQGMNYQNYIQSDCLLQNAVLHSSGHSIELLLD